MKTLRVELNDKSYPIYIGSGLLQQKEYLINHIKASQVLIVTNTTIAPLYLAKIVSLLDSFQVEVIELPDGEQYKNLEHINLIFNHLLEKKFSRNATLVALGGGVVGDMGGFAAACYQRGIDFIQIPTTVLAQVDSSVGGKTGVNHPLGKNMIGAFYQPQCVISDMDVFDSLEDRQFISGLSEVIKYGLIRDVNLFEWLEQNMSLLLNRDKQALAYVIEKSCQNKADIVAEDEFESGIRAILNLGHTFGHAIETGMGYGYYLHGEAVAIGIGFAADLSQRMGWIDSTDVDRIITLLKCAKLPVIPPSEMSVNQYIDLMAVDKKNLDGNIRVILLKSIGKATLPISIKQSKLEQTLQYYVG